MQIDESIHTTMRDKVKRIDTVFINYDEETRRRMDSTYRKEDDSSTMPKNLTPNSRQIQSKTFNLNLHGVIRDDQEREIKNQ